MDRIPDGPNYRRRTSEEVPPMAFDRYTEAERAHPEDDRP